MHKFITSVILSAPLILALPVTAQARGFDSTISTPLTTPVKIEISLSEDLAHRASNLPKKLSDRSSGGGFGTAFSNNGHYGDKDLMKLQARLEDRLMQQFAKRGIAVSQGAPTVLRVTITDVKNNRPTFEQLSEDPGLSYKSFGRGGAEFDAELVAAGGASLGTMNYDWYENDIRDANFGGTWSDTHRAINRFAKKAAKDLTRGAHS